MLIVIFLLLWIGTQLNAPNWYPWVVGVLAVWSVLGMLGEDHGTDER
jgi:hypothetical protein